jgi:sigma-B regulation protein RsbU (phosphoserine phosphatase)
MLARWPNHASGAGDLRAPIRVGGQILGELRIGGVAERADTSSRLAADVAVIERLAQLDNEMEQLTAELVQSQDQLLALVAINLSTRNHLQLDETLHTLARETTRLIRCEAVYISMAGAPGGTLHLPDSAEGSKFEPPAELMQRLQGSSYNLLLNDADDPALLAAGIRNLCAVPINLGNTLTAGGLALINKAGAGFGAADRKLARVIAEQAGAMIERSLFFQEHVGQLRMHTEMDLARQVQLRLLPRNPPLVPGLELAARSRPALQVGGDFYDFVAPPGRPFIFTVGDIAGKGMAAALLMTMTRTALRSKANFLALPSPEAIMSRCHEDLYDDFTEVNVFATVFIGQYSAQDGLLHYANAAHTPVIYRPANGLACLLEPDAPAMGVLPMSLCELQQVPLGPGDLLIVASDGFSEARDQHGALFGIERLLYLADRVAHLSAQSIAEAFFDAVDSFGDGHAQDDDQTLVVVKGDVRVGV